MDFIDYVPEMGSYTLPDGLRELLEGKTPEEQTDNFVMTMQHFAGKSLRFDCKRPVPEDLRYSHPLEEDEYLQAIIVDKGFIVGARINDVHLFVDRPHCVSVYYASDNNGAGYKEYEEYRYFVPLHKDVLQYRQSMTQ